MLYLLIDSRRGIFKPSDLEFLRIIQDNNVPFTIVLTKIDKVSDEQLKNALFNILEHFPEEQRPLVLASSSKTKSGLQILKISISTVTKLDKSKKYEFESKVVQLPRKEPEKPKPVKKQFVKKINPELERKKKLSIDSEEFARKRKFVYKSKLFEEKRNDKDRYKKIKKITFLRKRDKRKK